MYPDQFALHYNTVIYSIASNSWRDLLFSETLRNSLIFLERLRKCYRMSPDNLQKSPKFSKTLWNSLEVSKNYPKFSKNLQRISITPKISKNLLKLSGTLWNSLKVTVPLHKSPKISETLLTLFILGFLVQSGIGGEGGRNQPCGHKIVNNALWKM